MNAPVTDIRLEARALLSPLLGDEQAAANLETNLYNCAISTADVRSVDPHWDDEEFQTLYGTKVIHAAYALCSSEAILNNVVSKHVRLREFARLLPLNAPVNATRQRVRDLLEAVLGDAGAAVNLEVNIYNYTVEETSKLLVIPYWHTHLFSHMYTSKARSILFNLRNKSNTGLLASVKSGAVKLHRLVRMSALETFPVKWEPIIEEVAKVQLRKEIGKMADVDGVFPCRSCKSKKTVYTQLQTRSADEPMTTFVTCIDCNKMYKF